MRLLHISDWHIGLTTGPHARRPDHERAIAETVAIVRELRPDLILHTGDVFHANSPAVDDLRFGLEGLRELAALAPVLVVRGNHDSDKLFRVFSLLLGTGSRLRFIDLPPALGGDPIVRFAAADGTAIAVAPLPFVHANRFFPAYTEAASQTATFADKLGAYERALGAKLVEGLDPTREVAVFAAHQFVAGARKAGSERSLHVSDEYLTRIGDVPSVAYAAFGHIHRPQAIPGPRPANYAGSPIQVDFGEEGETKSVVFVEARSGAAARIEVLPLSGGRPLRTLRTDLASLAMQAAAYAGSLCRAIVQTPKPTSNLTALVARALPDTDLVDVIEECATARIATIEPHAVEDEPSLSELFAEFLSQQPVRGASAAQVRDAFEVVLAATQAHEEPQFPELTEVRP